MVSRNPEEQPEDAGGGGFDEGGSGGVRSRVTDDVVSRALGVDIEQLAASVNSPKAEREAGGDEELRDGVAGVPAGRADARRGGRQRRSDRTPRARPVVPQTAADDGLRPVAGVLSLEDFLERNKLVLGRGRRELARALYNLTYAKGLTECFTGYTELARLSGRTKRRCQDLLSELQELGFVEVGETVNTAAKKGRVIRFFLTPRVRAV